MDLNSGDLFNDYMKNNKEQTDFLTTIYEGLTEICKTKEEQNLSDEEFKEKVFTFLRTPEEGRQRRSQIREMAEDFVKEYFERYEKELPKVYKETLPSFIMKVMPVAIRVIEQKQTALEQFAIALYEKGLLIGNGDWMQDVLKEFKEMEKEQHGKTWDKAMDNLDARGGNIIRAWVDFDEYYEQTYGGEQ